MAIYTFDTNILSYMIKDKINLDDKIEQKIMKGNRIYLNPIVYYEIRRGLLFVKDHKRLALFNAIVTQSDLLEINQSVLDHASEIYAHLRRKGQLIEDSDILIGAICLHYQAVLITNNEKHFQRIPDLKYENWL